MRYEYGAKRAATAVTVLNNFSQMIDFPWGSLSGFSGPQAPFASAQFAMNCALVNHTIASTSVLSQLTRS
jgi:hypothetical protein